MHRTAYRFAIRHKNGAWVAPCRYNRLTGRLILPVVFCAHINDAKLYKSKGNAKAFLTRAKLSPEIDGVTIVPLYLTLLSSPGA